MPVSSQERSMSTSPNAIVSAQGLRSKSSVATAAKVTLNDATNSVLAFAAGTNGSVVYSVKAKASVTATQIQLYRSPDNGVTLNFINDALMAAATVNQITAVAPTDLGYTETQGLRLAPGDSLYWGIGVALAGGVILDVTGEDL